MTLVSLLACFFVLLGPGLGGALALYRPGEIGLPLRLALSFALGSVIAALVAFGLAIGGVLSAPSFLSLTGMVTAALWYVGVSRGRGVEHVRAVAAEVRGDPWRLGAGLAVIAGIALLRLTVSPLVHFSASTSWRYWADAVEIADAGAVPDAVLQYGMVLQPVLNKVLVSTLGAGMGLSVGAEPLPAMAALLWLSSVGFAVALWSVGHELGLRFTAPLLPVLAMSNRLFLNQEITADLNNFKAETFGRMVAFTALAVAVRALRLRRWKDALISGALVGTTAGMHMVPVIIVAGFLAFYVLARLLLDGDVLNLSVRAASIVAVSAVVAGIILFLPRGDVGVSRSSARLDPTQRYDPTRYLNAGELVPIESPTQWYIGPRRALDTYVTTATGLPSKSSLMKLLPIGLALAGMALAVSMMIWFPRPLRPLGVAAVGLAGFLVALTWLFSLRYGLYVPAYFGLRRLLDYSSIPLILAGLAVVEWGVLRWQPERRRAVIAVSLVIAVAAIPFIATARPGGSASKQRAVAAAFTWMRQRLPCDARVLPDLHTEGVFEALTGRVSILEGATPYLRPPLREAVIRLFMDARRFFSSPTRNRRFLERHGVDYVVLLRDVPVGYREPLGAGTRAKMTRAAAFLRPLYLSPNVDVYRVLRNGRGRFPRADTFPGYTCRRDPIAV